VRILALIKVAAGLLALAASASWASTTLRCEAKNRCDAFIKNCVEDPFTFTATVDPKRRIVILGGNKLKADFSNPAEVSFSFTKYLVRLNRHEYSATLLATDGEVRYGQCMKVEPAW
jgi:hypothetical protein